MFIFRKSFNILEKTQLGELNQCSPSKRRCLDLSWPQTMNFNDSIQLIREYDKQINYKLLKRHVCCVCGRFNISSESDANKYDQDLLLTNRAVLHKNNLGVERYDNDFMYDTEFSNLNGLVLCKKGFDYVSKQVCIIYNILRDLNFKWFYSHDY
jgi:hypothetical protein